uniref:Uncharacterized protein n=1 Tax=Anopheles atroparvus TaxID=41427 RepID=A0A182JIE7_ANOAO
MEMSVAPKKENAGGTAAAHAEETVDGTEAARHLARPDGGSLRRSCSTFDRGIVLSSLSSSSSSSSSLPSSSTLSLQLHTYSMNQMNPVIADQTCHGSSPNVKLMLTKPKKYPTSPLRKQISNRSRFSGMAVAPTSGNKGAAEWDGRKAHGQVHSSPSTATDDAGTLYWTAYDTSKTARSLAPRAAVTGIRKLKQNRPAGELRRLTERNRNSSIMEVTRLQLPLRMLGYRLVHATLTDCDGAVQLVQQPHPKPLQDEVQAGQERHEQEQTGTDHVVVVILRALERISGLHVSTTYRLLPATSMMLSRSESTVRRSIHTARPMPRSTTLSALPNWSKLNGMTTSGTCRSMASSIDCWPPCITNAFTLGSITLPAGYQPGCPLSTRSSPAFSWDEVRKVDPTQTPHGTVARVEFWTESREYASICVRQHFTPQAIRRATRAFRERRFCRGWKLTEQILLGQPALHPYVGGAVQIQVGVVLPQDVVLERLEHLEEQVEVPLVERVAADERTEAEVHDAVLGAVQVRLQVGRQRLRWLNVHEAELDRVGQDGPHVAEARLGVDHEKVDALHQLGRARHVAAEVLLDHPVEGGEVGRHDVVLDHQVRQDRLHPLQEGEVARKLVVHLRMRHHVHHVAHRLVAGAHRVDRGDADHGRVEQLGERVHRRELVVLHDHHVEVRVPAADQRLHVRVRQLRLEEEPRQRAQLRRYLVEVHVPLLHVDHVEVVVHYLVREAPVDHGHVRVVRRERIRRHHRQLVTALDEPVHERSVHYLVASGRRREDGQYPSPVG